MLKNERKAGAEVDSSTTADTLPSASIAQNPLLAAAFSSELVSNARYYAVKVHNATNHKYDGKPYEVHLQMVYDFACKYVHLLPNNRIISEVLAACWVHDVIEDCRQTYNDVREVLGGAVAGITYALTNEKGRNRKERANEKYYDEIRNTPFASFVKICDRLANVKYSKESGSKMIEAYKKEQPFFKQQLWSLSVNDMFEELETLLS